MSESDVKLLEYRLRGLSNLSNNQTELSNAGRVPSQKVKIDRDAI